MTAGAIIFWLASWAFVLGLTFYCFWRILRLRKHHDPDGTGPAKPPLPPAVGEQGSE